MEDSYPIDKAIDTSAGNWEYYPSHQYVTSIDINIDMASSPIKPPSGASSPSPAYSSALPEDAPPGFTMTVNEKHLIRKLDRHIIPIVMALYLFSFLDRVNIGNARLYGLESDLGLVGVQFQVAVSVLFATYIVSSTMFPCALSL